jgi:hypothetical protein
MTCLHRLHEARLPELGGLAIGEAHGTSNRRGDCALEVGR